MESPRRVAIFGVLAFTVLFHVRLGLETIHFLQYLDRTALFSMRTFTDQISVSERDTLRLGDHLLAVNGRPFRGLSSLLLESHKGRDQPPMRVTLRSGESAPREVELQSPNIIMGYGHTVWLYYVLIPLVCIGFGFLPLWRRPDSLLAMAFAGLLLLFAQTPFW